jgi:hypothetical protein
MALVAGGVVLLMELSGNGLAALTSTDRPGGGDGRMFVPLFEVTTRWEHYTMFSWAHLLDWLNMQMLTAPVTLGGLVIIGVALLADRLGIHSQAATAKHAEASSDGRALTFWRCPPGCIGCSPGCGTPTTAASAIGTCSAWRPSPVRCCWRACCRGAA